MTRPDVKISSGEQRRRVAVDISARRHIVDRTVAADVAQRATQSPPPAHRAIAADKEPAIRLVHTGRVAVARERAPVAEYFVPRPDTPRFAAGASEDGRPHWAVGRPACAGASRLARKWACGSMRTVSPGSATLLAVLACASPDNMFKAERASSGVVERTAVATWLAPVPVAAPATEPANPLLPVEPAPVAPWPNRWLMRCRS